MTLDIRSYATHGAMSQWAASHIEQYLVDHPGALICLAAGNTPLATYELLVQRLKLRLDVVERLRVVKLDEWGGLAMDDPASCEAYLQRWFIQPLGCQARYLALNGDATDPEAECRRVADQLASIGPIDLCVLGLGVNGHIGFNEPASSLVAGVHCTPLSPESLRHSTLADARTSPRFGMTLGMADILRARQVLLLVSGASKRRPLRRLVSGRITTRFPASLLLTHPHLMVLCDAAALPSATPSAPESAGPATRPSTAGPTPGTCS